MSLSACNKTDLGGDFEIIDGGGSKRSLSREGIIIISYTITGLGKFEDYVFLENRPYGSGVCEYFVLDYLNSTVTNIDRVYLHNRRISPELASRFIEPLTYRSCESHPFVEETNLKLR